MGYDDNYNSLPLLSVFGWIFAKSHQNRSKKWQFQGEMRSKY